MTQSTDFNSRPVSPPTVPGEQLNALTGPSGWPPTVTGRAQIIERVESAGQLLARGELAGSRLQYRALLQIGLTKHDTELVEVACHNLAAVFRQSRHWNEAEIWQQQSFRWRMRHDGESLNQSLDDLGRLACDLTGRGGDAFLQRDWELAEALWRRALAIEEWRGSLEGQATDSGNLGLLAAARGQLEDGIRWLKQSLRLHRLLLDACGEGTDLMNLAELRRQLGEYSFATHLLRKAIRCFERAEATPLRVLATLRLGEAQRFVDLATFDSQLN